MNFGLKCSTGSGSIHRLMEYISCKHGGGGGGGGGGALLYLCARLFICALWSLAGKGLTSWLSFVVSICEFVTFHLVSWVRCGT